ncbi:MAG: hypothetical protein VW779_03355, partial [Halieaceae bacterium]
MIRNVDTYTGRQLSMVKRFTSYVFTPGGSMKKTFMLVALGTLLATSAYGAEKQLYWGDTHLHTNRSF